MTTKEKAEELYLAMGKSIQSAIACVEEIREEVREYGDYNHTQDRMIFWGNVINELNLFVTPQIRVFE